MLTRCCRWVAVILTRCRLSRCPGRRRAASPWSPRGSATLATRRRRCAPSRARSHAPACSRSTRSTCCSGPTTCRCSRGWVPTTPSMLQAGLGAASRAGWSSTGPTSQAFMPVDLWPVMQHRMAGYRERGARVDAWLKANRATDRLAARPRCATTEPRPHATSTTALPAAEGRLGLELVARRARRLDYLFISGDLAIAGRNSQFEPVYDLPERVMPVGDPRPAGARPGTRPRSSWSGGPPAATASRRCAACATTTVSSSQRGEGTKTPMLAIDELVEDGRAAPGHDRGLEAPGVPPPGRRPAPQGRGPRPAEPVRPGGVGARAHRAPLRLPLPHRDLRARSRSASSATTCCRSCSATGSSVGSTSRPTGRPGRCWSRRPTPSPVRRRRPRASWPPSCATWRRWLGLDDIVVDERGDLSGGAACRADRSGSHRLVSGAHQRPRMVASSRAQLLDQAGRGGGPVESSDLRAQAGSGPSVRTVGEQPRDHAPQLRGLRLLGDELARRRLS